MFQKLSNHPVHIVSEDGKMSPTALIPFCELGGDMSLMGVKIGQMDVPVCNSFEAKILQNQICYTVDPNRYKQFIEKGMCRNWLFISNSKFLDVKRI